jgi:site-specific DNA recombinase
MISMITTVRTTQVADQQARDKALSRMADPVRVRRDRQSWKGEDAAIYCRISHVKDDDQTGVDRQERICREVIKRLGLVVAQVHVFIDNNRSAWQRNQQRKGWDALLEVARNEGIRHIVAYHPDRLMRQPKDLEELLTISDEHGITLHGQANQRDLSDPDDRFFLRIEVAHACRSSDDTSRRLKDAMVDRARDGKPHSGKRRYGYTADGMTIIPEEAGIVLWIFESFLAGMTPYAIAADLDRRNIPTVQGKRWGANGVLRVLDSRHVAGILVFRGKEIGPGTWPAIIGPGMWAETRERRVYRSAVAKETRSPDRYYLLRGLVWCAACGRRMAGKMVNGWPTYICYGHAAKDKADRCWRTASAVPVEGFVTDAAINLLERLDVTGQEASAMVLSAEDVAAIEADRGEIAELKDAWDNREISTSEYREMRKTVESRIKRIEAKTIVRPAAEVLEGLPGPDARACWDALENAGNTERLNAVLRFLFAAVRIDGPGRGGPRFDYGRIGIEQNDLG